MNAFPLTSEERNATGFTHRFEVTHEDLTQAATNTAQAITLFTLKAGQMVGKVATRLTTVFQDISDSAFNVTTVTIGDSGSAARFLASQELNVNGTEILTKAGTGTLLAYNGADTLLATFGSMTAKSLVDIDAGKLVIFASIVDLKAAAGA